MDQIQTDYSTNLPAHAEMLKGFFSILFSPNEPVLMVPGLNKDRFDALCANLGDWPKEVGGRKTTYFSKEHGRIQPRRYLNPFSRSPASASTRNLAALHEINRQGYDIFFAINPMTCRRRCQKTVTMAMHVLIESDENDIDAQLRFLKEHEANVVSAVHSGGKSIHCLVRISPPRLHPGAVGWMEASRLGKGETKAPWPDYRRMGDYWIAEAKKHGIGIDAGAAHDHARISRTPGFLHSKTGRRAEVVSLNPSASWDWKDSMRSSILSIYENQNDDDSFSILNPKTKTLRDSRKTHINLRKTNPAPKNVVRATGGQNICESSQRSFLDLVDDFENLQQNGLPGRHVRRSMHRALFEAVRVFGWDESEMVKEWGGVIEKNPEATVESAESAVEDMLRAFTATDGIGVYLPDLTKLPELNEQHMEMMMRRLDALGCEETPKASRIIARVVFPLLKAFPHICLKGPIGISSRSLRAAANSREKYRGHKRVWTWMRAAKIVKCTEFQYIPHELCRQYRINIPMLIWLCGYKTDDLDWNMAKRNWLPEILGMRVINDVAGDYGAAGFESVVEE